VEREDRYREMIGKERKNDRMKEKETEMSIREQEG
jgi:hypothetical protein